MGRRTRAVYSAPTGRSQSSAGSSAAFAAEEVALPGRSARPLTLAFLGDPNSIHTRRWIAFFVDRGHRIHLLVPSGEIIKPGLDDRVQIHRFTISPRLAVRGLASLVTRRNLRRVLRDADPQILHAHALQRYGWLAHLSGFRPFVISAWGSDVFRASETSWWAQYRSRRALVAAALVTAVSGPLAQAAIHLGAHADRVRIVHFGVDPGRFAPGPVSSELQGRIGTTGHRVVFAPRALRPLYRQEVVVTALAQLPDDVVAIFAEGGQGDDVPERLRTLAAELGVSARLRFVPAIPHEEMPEFYRLADVVVSVPESDAWPVTALEAMASGTPIVLSDLPSAREGLEHVDPSAIVPVGDATATARAIRTRLDLTPDARADLGQRLRKAAIERGDMRTNLLEMEHQYRHLVARE